MNDADFWELLTKNGIKPDSATAIVQSHKGQSDADLWERLTKNGAAPDAATSIVQARGASGPAPITARDLLRSAGQGATFGFSDELGLADKDKQKQFQKDHPYADFAAKLVGGLAAPAVATLAAPEALAGAGVLGVAGMGAAQGALSGAGEAEGGLLNRAKGAAIGGAIGGIAAPALSGAAQAVGGLFGAIGKKVAPNIAAKKAAATAVRSLLDDPAAVQAHMNEINALAPGGSNMVTAAVGPETGKPRMLGMVRTVGESPDAAKAAEAGNVAQRAALGTGMDNVGAKIDALDKAVPITPTIRSALNEAKRVLGAARVDVPPPNSISPPAPAGFQPTALAGIPQTQSTITTQELRNVLSDLRDKRASLLEQGIDANGVSKRAVNQAHDELKDIVYSHVPGYKPLDVQYAKLADEVRALDRVQPTVEDARMNAAGHTTAGTKPGSLGGSITASPTHITDVVLNKLLEHKAAGADAVSKYVLTPKDATAIRSLLDAAPTPLPAHLRALSKSGLLEAPVNAARSTGRSLMFPDSQY